MEVKTEERQSESKRRQEGRELSVLFLSRSRDLPPLFFTIAHFTKTEN